MDRNELRRAIVRSAVHKGIKEVPQDPDRGIRKLVDLGSHFAKGRFQKIIFDLMQEQLIHEESGYHRVACRIIRQVRPDHLEDFGFNIGYNSWTEGARRIRRREAEQGYNVPWCILAELTQEMQFDLDDLMTQGEKLGIYCYILFAGKSAQAAELFPVVKKHKDSAVIWLTESAELPHINIENVNNVLCLLPLRAEGTEQSARMLMEKKCVCGVWASYGQEDLSRLMDGSDEKKAAACGAMSLFVMPKEGQEDAVQEALSRYVQEKRDSAEFSCVPIDLMRDIERVDSIISVQSCMLFVRADGLVHTGSRQHDNLHVTDIALEDILMCTMPRVTYRTDEKIKE